MSEELDLFGNPIAVDKKRPSKREFPTYTAPIQNRVEVAVDRPCSVVKTGRHEALVINSDYAHLFR